MLIPTLMHGDLGQVAAASRAKHGEGLPNTQYRSVQPICPPKLVYTIKQRRIDTEFFSLKRTFSLMFCPRRALLHPESWTLSPNWSKQTLCKIAIHRDVMLRIWDFGFFYDVTVFWASLKLFVTIVKSELPWNVVLNPFKRKFTYSTRFFMGKTCEIRFFGVPFHRGDQGKRVFRKFFEKSLLLVRNRRTL